EGDDESSSGSSLLLEHDLFRKPVSTFRDHALERAQFGFSTFDKARQSARTARGMTPDRAKAARELLAFYVEAGVDGLVADEPTNWLVDPATAPAAQAAESPRELPPRELPALPAKDRPGADARSAAAAAAPAAP